MQNQGSETKICGQLKSARNYGIDLLRLVSMFMICVLHVCGQGGAMTHFFGNEITWHAVYILETAAYCAVNVYGLISGYVGIRAKHRTVRLLELWLTVFWYSALGSLLAVYVFRLPPEDDSLYKAIFPTMWKTYWYFSSYVGVFFAAPFLNRMVKALGREEQKKLIVTAFFLCTVFTMVPRASDTGSDFLGLGAGYSFLWLAVLYAVGACVRELTDRSAGSSGNGPGAGKSDAGQTVSGKTVSGQAKAGQAGGGLPEKTDFLHRSTGFYCRLYAVNVLIAWASKILIESVTTDIYGQPKYGRLLFSYTAPTIALCAFALLMVFSRMKVERPHVRRVIRKLSPMAFSVYLVQVQPFFWNHVLKGRFTWIGEQGPAEACALVLLLALGLYVFCNAADLVRFLIFAILKKRIAKRRTGKTSVS